MVAWKMQNKHVKCAAVTRVCAVSIWQRTRNNWQMAEGNLSVAADRSAIFKHLLTYINIF